MLLPCEVMVKEFVPALKNEIIRELYNEFDFDQKTIAKTLGMTQAAVSNYLSGKYAKTKAVAKNSKNPVVLKKARDIAEAIAKKNIGKEELTMMVCSCCEDLVEGSMGCRLNTNVAGASHA